MSNLSFKTPFLIHGGFLSFFIALGLLVLLAIGLEGRILLFIGDFMSLRYFGLPESLRTLLGVVNWFSVALVILEGTRRAFSMSPFRVKARA